MKLFTLYLRSRRAGFAAVSLIAVAILGWIGADWMLQLPQFGGASGHSLIPAILLMPILSGCVIALTTPSPFGETERTGSRSLPALRLLHLGGLLLWAAMTFVFVARQWAHPAAELMLARNLAGFTGLALLGARLLGGRLSWVLPIAFGGVVTLTGRDGAGQFAWWAWSIRPGEDALAALLALVALIAGLAAVSLLGPRERVGDVE
jgi:hypothetical protein